MTHEAGAPAPPLILDACVVLNLYASRQMPHILRSLERDCLVADAVQAEALRHLGIAAYGTGQMEVARQRCPAIPGRR